MSTALAGFNVTKQQDQSNPGRPVLKVMLYWASWQTRQDGPSSHCCFVYKENVCSVVSYNMETTYRGILNSGGWSGTKTTAAGLAANIGC